MLTCKEFLDDLNDYLDESVGQDVRLKLEMHVRQCPNCFVVADTTRRTLKVYRGCEAQPIPADIQERLLNALQKRMAAKRAV